ncbi:hypothetical protein BSKO_10931 [Bryopsis sp. KO-2023]|nr:hypothetical protein BSKO_10931 [Bryopsis sp. KO-2023]
MGDFTFRPSPQLQAVPTISSLRRRLPHRLEEYDRFRAEIQIKTWKLDKREADIRLRGARIDREAARVDACSREIEAKQERLEKLAAELQAKEDILKQLERRLAEKESLLCQKEQSVHRVVKERKTEGVRAQQEVETSVQAASPSVEAAGLTAPPVVSTDASIDALGKDAEVEASPSTIAERKTIVESTVVTSGKRKAKRSRENDDFAQDLERPRKRR